MPDLPPSKRRPVIHAVASDSTPRASYAELHCLTNYSFLTGASHPDELVQRAAELGYRALAITDINSVAGVVRAHAAAKQLGFKLLIGSEIIPIDAPPVVLLATDRSAYGRLCTLITRGRLNAAKGDCRLTFDDIAEHAKGLLACVPLSDDAHREGPAALARYGEVFGDRIYALAELHRGPDDQRKLPDWRALARQCRVPLVAANDVHYHDPARQRLQDVLTAIREGCPVADLGFRRFPNAERHLKSPDEMRRLFADCPAAVARTVEIADRCTFSLDELRYEYPEELCPAGVTPLEHLARLTWKGAAERYPASVPDKVRSLIERELRLIEDLRYEAYFLTVWDLVRFARSHDILCQGRGSAANSVVCYCLGVTSVSPEQVDVLFERFVSKERGEAPDIDIDFEHERREEVIQYCYQKYGRDRAGMTATVITYRPRSAVRDVGKALGFSLAEVDALAKTLEHFEDPQIASRLHEAGLNPRTRAAIQLRELVTEILGFPRHLSQHTGGMVFTQGPLHEMVPIENATMPDRTVIQWDKDDLDALGLLKVDCLALGMLTAIRKCFDLVKQHEGRALTLATIPAEDPAVYEMAGRADTIGVFQIESRAQMSTLPRLKPKSFYDLVIEVALIRPGPIQGNMVHPYLRRRDKLEPVEYPDARIEGVLHKTLGVPLFQEQAMKIAIVAAGFSPGEADALRRAMGAWRRPGIIDQFRQKFLDGMATNGYSADFAERMFAQIHGFGSYGFPESHSASFALLVYASAWLKCYYQAAFTAALLNSQPMGFYAPSQLVKDAQQHGVEVRPVDVAHSEWDCTLESQSHGQAWAIRLGFRMLKGLSRAAADRIVETRSSGPFASFDDFAYRTRLSEPVLIRLSKADAFSSLRLDRRVALWQSLPVQKTMPLFDDPALAPDAEPIVPLPIPSPFAEVAADYRTTGLSLKDHPLRFLRPMLRELRVTPASDLAVFPVDRRVRVAGLVLMRQRPGSAKGITFVTLEDETGVVNLIIRPEVWERHHRVARTAKVMLVTGHLQRQHSVIHVIAVRLQDLSSLLADLATQSRDFR